jgi:hypothetical protein
MEDSVLEAAKGFSEGHVTNDVKRSEVLRSCQLSGWHVQVGGNKHTKPIAHVERLASFRKGPELLDEEVDVASDDTLLLEQSFLAECMG